MYYDANGLIVQQDGDGGDTSGREGDYWFAKGSGLSVPDRNIDFDHVLGLLEVKKGLFIRNPVNYNDPKDFSRDQTIPLILAMGVKKRYATLRHLFLRQIFRLGMYQNFDVKLSNIPDPKYTRIVGNLQVKGDIGFLQDLGYYIRAFKFFPLYPLLLLGDLQMIVNSIIRCIKGSSSDTSDDINHTLALCQAQNSLATPLSFLARKIYKIFRRGGIQNAFNNYFSAASGANVEFVQIYAPLIDRM